MRCFGVPEEIGAGLFRANFHRLRRWAKVRFAIRILTVPAVLAALLLVLNFDVIGGLERLRDLRLFDAIPLPEFLFEAAGWWNAVPPADAVESSSGDLPGLADRIVAGERRAGGRSGFFDVAIRHEPENALYRYEKAAALVTESVPEIATADFVRSAAVLPPISQRARRKLELAAELYRSALLCPRCTDYAAERNRRDNRRRYPNENFHSLVGRLADATVFPLPQLAAYRRLGRWMPFYAALLIREGRVHEAGTLLDSWKRFTVHQLQDCDTVVGVLTLQGILEKWREELPPLYAALGEVGKGRIVADEIARITAPVRRWREAAGNLPVLQAGGIFSVFSAWNPQEVADAAQLSADRRITRALGDQLTLLGFWGIGLGITLLFVLLRLAEWLCGRREVWLRLSGRQVCRLLCFGILLPLVLCWMLAHVELFSGRGTAAFRNPFVWLQWGGPDRSARLVYGLSPAAVGRAGALSSAGAGGEEAFPVLPVRLVRLHPAAVDLFSVDFRRFCALVGRAGSVARHGRGAVEFFRIPDHDGGALDLSHAIGHASGRCRTRERLKALYSDSARLNRGTSPGGRSR